MDRNSIRLYLVTDRGLAGSGNIVDIVREAVLGGVTMVQLREKSLNTRDFIRLAQEMKRAIGTVPLIINDRVDVALASGADGVHIGQSDMPYEMARKLMGPDRIIGLSVENMDQVREAEGLDVDYLGISPVFDTPTKTDTAPAFGLEGLRCAAQISRHPLVAIGGIKIANAADAVAAGADGIAVVSAIVCAPDPSEAASELKKEVTYGLGRI